MTKIQTLMTILSALTLMSGCSGTNSETIVKQEVIVIDGYELPPMPDPYINDETLLGVDVNDNGVRDDVEIYIYERFKEGANYKIDRAIAMQYAKATQIIISDDPEHAYENRTYKVMHDAIDCQWYYFDEQLKDVTDHFKRGKYRYDHKIFDDETKDRIFDTKERLDAYFKYNDSLSGHVYDSRPTVKEKCIFDIKAFGTL